ncbi:MAG: TA0956 family protein [Thermoplasmatales archaeon]|jgi:hypothetical protein
MKCYVLMLSFNPRDRSNICVLEDRIVDAVEEMIQIDPEDKWMMEEMISKFARNDPITENDKTVGYVLLSFVDKTAEIETTELADSSKAKELRKIIEENGFKIISS